MPEQLVTRTVVHEVTCGQCGHFLGLITSDGQGPFFDGCQSKYKTQRADCAMVQRLAGYQSPERTAELDAIK